MSYCYAAVENEYTKQYSIFASKTLQTFPNPQPMSSTSYGPHGLSHLLGSLAPFSTTLLQASRSPCTPWEHTEAIVLVFPSFWKVPLPCRPTSFLLHSLAHGLQTAGPVPFHREQLAVLHTAIIDSLSSSTYTFQSCSLLFYRCLRIEAGSCSRPDKYVLNHTDAQG